MEKEVKSAKDKEQGKEWKREVGGREKRKEVEKKEGAEEEK